MRNCMLLALMAISINLYAQKEKSPFQKFGKITQEVLATRSYSIDTTAGAVVLSDIGESAIEGNSKGWFSLRTSHHTVIHILKENGYGEANQEIALYKSGEVEEKLQSFKAITYNLENGKITENKLSKNDLIRDKADKNRTVLKFTMPNVKRGSVIEFSYEVFSDFISMPDPWYFQSTTAPTLWSEYNFAVPQFFIYSISSRGFLPMDLVENSKKEESFRVMETRSATSSESIDFKSNVVFNRWVIKNAPQLKEEPFTKSVRNHLSRLDFQLSAQNYPLAAKSYRSTWQKIAENMLESEFFGKNLNSNNNWLKDELKPLLVDENDPLKKAKKIFAFVRDQYKTTSQYAIFMTDNLKSVFKNKKGNVCELNLLLTAMLRYADIEADPVLLSTADHGYALEYLPMLTSMNYVVCKVNIGGKSYFLDASQSMLGFGKLPEYCYNGFSYVISKSPFTIDLSSDVASENRTVNFIFSDVGKGYEGSATKTEGYYASSDIRSRIDKDGEQSYFDEVKKKMAGNVELYDFKIDSLSQYEEPLKVSYKIKLGQSGEDVIYMNPYFGEAYSKNPFVSANRVYPVEFPYTQDEKIYGTIAVPRGYRVDELPKQILVKLDPEGKSYFEYRISNSGNMISFLSKIKIAKTLFLPEEYNTLREFFNLIVKKQSEQIVFKKIAE